MVMWMIPFGSNDWWDRMQRPKYAKEWLWKYPGFPIRVALYYWKKMKKKMKKKKKKKSRLP